MKWTVIMIIEGRKDERKLSHSNIPKLLKKKRVL